MRSENQMAMKKWGIVGAMALAPLIALLLGADGAKPKTSPIFKTLVDIETPTDLLLFAEGRQIVGWITGPKSFEGEKVEVEAAGRNSTAVVEAGNTFRWDFVGSGRTLATVRVAGLTRSDFVEIHNRESKRVAFFVVDRTVYRPGQKLQFVAFLCRETQQGDWVAVPRTGALVQLTTGGKKTVVAKLPLTSDDAGRITGEYTFGDADPLDSYTLAATGFQGQTEVQLAEYRKSKVRLAIDGERRGQRLTLKFQALDFLDKPVAGSKVSFTAKVLRNPAKNERLERSLATEKFAFANEAVERTFSFEDLNDEERLLAEAGQPTWSASPTPIQVAELKGTVGIGQANVAEGQEGRVGNPSYGEWSLALEKAWTQGDYSVQVEGVLVDYNGHEQRATRVIPIGDKVVDCDLKLHLVKQEFAVGETVRVRIEPKADSPDQPVTATMLAMRLAPPQAGTMPMMYGYGYGQFGYYNSYSPFYGRRMSRLAAGMWSRSSRESVAEQAESQRPRRSLVTASVVKDNAAAFTFDEPGAYKLVCVAELPDGRKLQNEIGCLVRAKEDIAPLVLKLDRDEIRAGESLRGELHCRFAGGRVLLTLRDVAGLRWWKSLTVDGGLARIDEPLPTGLSYGCIVEAHLLESTERLHVARRFLLVEPTDRTIGIEIRSQETYGPGEEVTLELQTDRREPVDLIVSVYDKSLLGIAADRATNARDFFLADDRVQASDREQLRRRLKGVTIRELIERMERRLKEEPGLAQSPAGESLANAVHHYRQGSGLYTFSLVSLLQEAGIDIVPHPLSLDAWSWHWHFPIDMNREATLPHLLEEALLNQHGEYRLHIRFAGSRVLLGVHNGRLDALHMQRANAVFGMGGYGMGRARGDGLFSPSANAAFSQMPVSGQAAFSHMPVLLPGPGPAGFEPVELTDSAIDTAVRRDFSDSAYWNSRLRTDDTGRATARFKLPDSLTNWQVVVTAVSPKLHVGHAKASFRTFRPIMIWPLLPRTFTEGDQVDVFGTVHNRTDTEQEIEVGMKVDVGRISNLSVHRPPTQPGPAGQADAGPRTVKIRVPPKSHVPVYWTYHSDQPGFAQLLMTAKCAAGNDASLKRIPVTPLAAEQIVTASGFARDRATLELPAGVPLKDARFEVTLVPSLLDDAVQSLEYLVEYPYGCVEQTMSRFLPAIVVKQTLDRAGLRNESLAAKLPGVVEGGIKRLLELQLPDGGWSWHGGGQTHEMMTPYAMYGLLRAEKAGYAIPNESAIQRGLSRLQQFIASQGEGQTADRVYCMYVYSLRADLDAKLWEFIEQQLAADKLSDYALAMCLEMAVAKSRGDLAPRLTAALHRRAAGNADQRYWTTAGFSRWGDDRFEITAAVLKALVAANPRDELIAPTLSFFAATKRGNRWNSTKDTAMIVYAICDCLAAQNVRAGERTTVSVSLNGSEPQSIELQPGVSPKLDLTAHLRPGANELRFTGPGGGSMFRAAIRYWQRGSAIQPVGKGLTIERRFFLLDDAGQRLREISRGGTVPRGSYLLSEVSVKHAQPQPMTYVLVENPKPSTCEILPSTDARFAETSTAYALREDRSFGVVYHHEQTPAELVDRCILHTELTGRYQLAPARVELMYDTLTRGHTTAFDILVE